MPYHVQTVSVPGGDNCHFRIAIDNVAGVDQRAVNTARDRSPRQASTDRLRHLSN